MFLHLLPFVCSDKVHFLSMQRRLGVRFLCAFKIDCSHLYPLWLLLCEINLNFLCIIPYLGFAHKTCYFVFRSLDVSEIFTCIFRRIDCDDYRLVPCPGGRQVKVDRDFLSRHDAFLQFLAFRLVSEIHILPGIF